MKNSKKYRYAATAIFLMMAITFTGMAQALPPPPPPPGNPPAGAPIDGGVVLLISSCLVYAWYRLKN